MYANKVRTEPTYFTTLSNLALNQHTITVCPDCGPGNRISVWKSDLAVLKKFLPVLLPAVFFLFSFFFSKSVQIGIRAHLLLTGVLCKI